MAIAMMTPAAATIVGSVGRPMRRLRFRMDMTCSLVVCVWIVCASSMGRL
jgi:hypothetical protein